MHAKVGVCLARTGSVISMLSVVVGLSACAVSPPPPAPPNDPVTLRINVFQGSSNTPIYMAI